MKKYILYFIFGSIFLYLQVSNIINNLFSINGILPDFLLIFIILIAYNTNSFEAELFGFILGFLLDIFSSTLFGISAFIYVIIGYGVGKFKNTFNVESILFMLLVVLIGTVIKIFFLYFFGYIFKEIFIIYKNFLLNITIAIIYNLFITPFIFYIINFLVFNKKKNN